MSVDLKRGETLPIHINMSFPSLPCEGQLLIKFSRSLIISLLQVLIWALLNDVFHDLLFETMFHDFDTSFSGSCLFSIECGCNWHVWETWSWFAHKYLEGNFSVQNSVPSGVCSGVLIHWLHLLLPLLMSCDEEALHIWVLLRAKCISSLVVSCFSYVNVELQRHVLLPALICILLHVNNIFHMYSYV